MAKQSKRKQAALAAIDRERTYPLKEAVALIKAGAATSKFDETIEIAMNLGEDEWRECGLIMMGQQLAKLQPMVCCP